MNPMRIQVLSDLHLEAGDWEYVPAEADLIILAGDIADLSMNGEARRQRLFGRISATGIPAVYILGNHEGYADWVPRDELFSRIHRRLPPSIRLLDREAFDCCGHRILGCTLWTDFSLVSGLRHHGIEMDQGGAAHIAGCSITDFRYLCRARRPGEQLKIITPQDMVEWYRADRSWLEQAVTNADRPVIVVTHFLPSPRSIASDFSGSILNPYFATDCEVLMRHPVRLWIHGHTHLSCDYVHQGVRVVCNPRGYAPAHVNPRWDPTLTIRL